MNTIGIVCSEPLMKSMLVLELSKKYNVIIKNFKLSDKLDCIVFDYDSTFDREIARGYNVSLLLGISTEKETKDIETDYLVVVRPFLNSDLFLSVEKILNRKQNLSLANNVGTHLPRLVPPKSVRINDDIVDLSDKEYKLLEYLLNEPTVPKSRESINQNVWDNAVDSNIIDVYMHYLRKKLEEPHNRKIIFTVRGKGYIIK